MFNCLVYLIHMIVLVTESFNNGHQKYPSLFFLPDQYRHWNHGICLCHLWHGDNATNGLCDLQLCRSPGFDCWCLLPHDRWPGAFGMWKGNKQVIYTYLHFSLSLLVLRLCDWIFWTIQNFTVKIWYHYCMLALEIIL